MKKLYDLRLPVWCLPVWYTVVLFLFPVLFTVDCATAQEPVKAAKEQAGEVRAEAGKAKGTETQQPDPLSVMKQMCEYLGSLQQFSYRADISHDQVYSGGRKLQYGLEMDTYVKRPDKLRVNADGDLVNKQLFLNGKVLTLYDVAKNVYATIDVLPDIESALDRAHKDFNLRVSLTELASPKLYDHVTKGIENPFYVGLHKVRGVPCHHIALERGGIHVQVWIDSGKKPLPLKVVFLRKDIEGSPQWTAYLKWNTSARVRNSLFTFVALKGAHKIKFVPAQQTPDTGKTEGDKS